MLDLVVTKPFLVGERQFSPGERIPVDLDAKTVQRQLNRRRVQMVYLAHPDDKAAAGSKAKAEAKAEAKARPRPRPKLDAAEAGEAPAPDGD